MEKFFNLKGHGTKVSTEVMAGFTTFFTMAYILFVNPSILALTGMPSQAVFLATIIAAAIGTLIMGLFANVPYAQAPGMGLNTFFTYTVCFALGFTWQEALALVFLCGLINILITVTRLRKMLLKAIPLSLQHGISGGIGIFVAYVGFKNAELLTFTSSSANILSVNGIAYHPEMNFGTVTNVVTSGGIVPDLSNFANPTALLAVIGILLIIVLVIKRVKGAIVISIVTLTLLSIVFGITDVGQINVSWTAVMEAFGELGVTFGAAFSHAGFGSLFNDISRLPLVLVTIFAFSLSDTFNTIGTLIGTGRKSGIFSIEDERALENSSGLKSKMDRALFADAIATSIGAVFGTSNVTTYVESAAGIGVGGRTGLTSVVVALLFLLSALLAPIIQVVPAVATAPALIIVGIMMMSSFKEINWDDLKEAIPAFFASVFMGLSYNISYGLAAGFITYCLIQIVLGKAKEVHPILYVTTGLFILNFVFLAII